MTDSKGDTVYFTETIIIFTSNAGIYRTMPDGTREAIVSERNSYDQIEASVREGLREYFVSQLNRPEILNRIGNNIVVFDFIRPPAVPAILNKQIRNICSNLEDSHNIRLELNESSAAWKVLEGKALQNLSFGGRGIGTLPVLGLGGILVAGHAGPGGTGICRKIRQKNLCGLEGDGHGKLLSGNKKCENDPSDQALLYRINGKIARAWRKFLSHPTKKRKIFHNKTFCSQNIV
jgi:hypothetical protein